MDEFKLTWHRENGSRYTTNVVGHVRIIEEFIRLVKQDDVMELRVVKNKKEWVNYEQFR